MSGVKDNFQLNDVFLFYPIYYSNYMNHLFAQMDDSVPKVQILILLTLKKMGPMPISHISDKVSMARPNMTAHIDNMSEKTWIKRTASTIDRRITNIELTEEGIAFLEAFMVKANQIIKEQFSVLTDKELFKLAECLEFMTSLGKKLLKQDI